MTSVAEPPASSAGGSFASAPVPVIGLAHGSRHPRGREAIEALMAEVEAQAGAPARTAYLDLAQPDLETVCAELCAAGHQRAVVVPLLFTEAFHATVDVPEAVVAATRSTGLDLVVTDILGTGDDVASMLLGTLAGADVGPEPDALLFAVGSSRAEANAAVADLAARLTAGRTGKVRAAFGTCDPRPAAVLDDVAGPVALWPLFLADGLLLDPLRRLATERGWPMVEPLGALAAPLVRARYAAGLERSRPGAVGAGR